MYDQRLNVSATTAEVAGRAIYRFKQDFPDRIAVWVENENRNSLDFTISSIHKTEKEGNLMRKHLFLHTKGQFEEVPR